MSPSDYAVTDFQPGDSVVYRPHPRAEPEDGVVVRTSDYYVFVRYRGSETPKATSPHHLTRALGSARLRRIR